MVQVNLGFTEIEFGVHLVEQDPGLTLILFIAFSLLLIIGTRFGYYAHRNLTATDIDSQRAIWRYLRYIGVFATLYGVVGVVGIISSLTFLGGNVFLLAMTLVAALAIRQIHYTGNADQGASATVEQLLRATFVALVFVYAVAVTVGPIRVAAGIEGVSALLYLLYGATFFQAQTANTRLQGTLLDSLLRHLLPLLSFASLVGIVALSTALGLEPVVVWHIQVVFIVMAATALVSATIKLRQNLAGL